MLHSSIVGKMIEVRDVVVRKQHVIGWNDISCALKEKFGWKHLRDGEGGPGFDFWLYFSDQVTEYIPDGITESPIDLLEHIECIEENGFTYPHDDDQKALPILKALAELIPENAVEEGFYVDFC